MSDTPIPPTSDPAPASPIGAPTGAARAASRRRATPPARRSWVVAAIVVVVLAITTVAVVLNIRSAATADDRPRVIAQDPDHIGKPGLSNPASEGTVDGQPPPASRLAFGAVLSGGLRLQYDDGTLVDLGPGSRATIAPGGGKRLTLAAGALGALVSPQPDGKPLRVTMAVGEALSPGGRFTVILNESKGFVRAQEGAVRAHPAGGAERVVAVGEVVEMGK